MTDYNNPLFLQIKKREKEGGSFYLLSQNKFYVCKDHARGCHVLVTSLSQSQAGAHVPQTPGPLPTLSSAQDPHSVGEEGSSVLRAAQRLTLPAEPADERAG